jgi:hypothetical protein
LNTSSSPCAGILLGPVEWPDARKRNQSIGLWPLARCANAVIPGRRESGGPGIQTEVTLDSGFVRRRFAPAAAPE